MTAPADKEPDRNKDQDLVEIWQEEPAPLLPLLHAFVQRDGSLSDTALTAIAKGLRIPLAELYGTVTFYHHLARSSDEGRAPRVCTGPVCALRGGPALLRELDGAKAMPCAGRCDEPVPVLREGEILVGENAASLERRSSPLPPPNPQGLEECAFAGIRDPDLGYQALDMAWAEMNPQEIIALITESGLAGRGGAGFPTGRKWQAVAEAEGQQKTVVCNADEGEPGCFKDRALLDHNPQQVIEGMLIAALATGASRGFIYLRYEYPETFDILQDALDEAEEFGLLGNCPIYLRRGAGAYVCGEEGALLNSLEGGHPFPRNRPPFPATHGYEGLPTLVNNVETLAAVPPILRQGAEWYRSLGCNGLAGTKVISLSGDIKRPGNYEVPMGLPLGTLLHDWAGGPHQGRQIQAVSMAGLSGGFLAGEDLEVSLDEPSIQSKGSFLGAGGIIVFDDSRNMVEVAHNAMDFFAKESCGKCFPCRIGTQRLAERLRGEAGPSELRALEAEFKDLGETMRATSACGLGMAAPLVVESLLRHFPEVVAERLCR